MALPVFDSIVIGIILISATLSSFRGFTREVLAITSWITAGFSAAFLYPYVLPYAENHIPNPIIALVLAVVAIFLLTLIGVSFFTSKIADGVAHSRIGALDRTLGLVFGTARGFLLCILGFLFFTWFLGHNSRQPDWLKGARTRPLLESGSQTVESIWSAHISHALPSLGVAEGMIKQITPAIERGLKDKRKAAAFLNTEDKEILSQPSSGSVSLESSPVYDTKDRRRLERLIGGG